MNYKPSRLDWLVDNASSRCTQKINSISTMTTLQAEQIHRHDLMDDMCCSPIPDIIYTITRRIDFTCIHRCLSACQSCFPLDKNHLNALAAYS